MEKSSKYTGVYRYVLKDGDIAYYYTYKDTFGKLHRVKAGRHSAGYREIDASHQRIAAIQKDKEMPEALRSKKLGKKKVVTFQDLADRYYTDRKDMKSYQDSIGKYNKIIKPVLGSRNVLTIKFEDLEKFQQELADKFLYAGNNSTLFLFLSWFRGYSGALGC